MDVLTAIKYFQQHYWDIDEHDRHGETMIPWHERGVTPETVLEILMEPIEECEEYGNDEWVEMIEKETDAVEAGWLVIEWIWTRQWARHDARAMKRYMESKPDHEEYESPIKREFDRPPYRETSKAQADKAQEVAETAEDCANRTDVKSVTGDADEGGNLLANLPKESDFPPGTVFVVKDGRDPYAMFPGPGKYDERLFSFCSGKKSRFPCGSTNLGGCSGWPNSMPFTEWLEAVEESVRDFVALKASLANPDERSSDSQQ